jgi:hypothetical protein
MIKRVIVDFGGVLANQDLGAREGVERSQALHFKVESWRPKLRRGSIEREIARGRRADASRGNDCEDEAESRTN